MDKKYKVILDTDPGDDIDDVLAVAYLLLSNKFELIGVTTSFKNTEKRARIIKKMLRLANFSHIPVYAGYGQPLVKQVPESQEINQYTSDLDSYEFKPDGYEEEAVKVWMVFDENDELLNSGVTLCNNLQTCAILLMTSSY